MTPRLVILALFLLILGIPFVMRPPQAGRSETGGAGTLVIVTPHVPQIQYEFGQAFEKWYQRTYGASVSVDWRQPGGTSEIIKQLSSQYSARCAEVVQSWRKTHPERLAAAALDLSEEFPKGTVSFDLMFGGGTFDHGRLKDPSNASYWFKPFEGVGSEAVMVKCKAPVEAKSVLADRQLTATVIRASGGAGVVARIPVSAIEEGAAGIDAISAASKLTPPGEAKVTLRLGQVERQAAVSMSVPAGFDPKQLAEIYGENTLGAGTLYDEKQYWLGTAVSGFGIVYNKDVVKSLALDPPSSFKDLADPRYMGWIVFADPRQSGSVATTIDAILSYYGWDDGWKLLRRMCANTRYYSNSAPRPPIDVSQGEAAAGLCIDFYGRNQSQAVLSPVETDAAASRVGYVDPPGATYMDADPISLLRGGPNPELAKRFIEFCLTEEAQALWQFPSKRDPRSEKNPEISGVGKLGPERNELRRMPIRRVMYEKFLPNMIDQANPFKLASTTKPAGWRGAIGIMMGAFGIETADEQVQAWKALVRAEQKQGFDQTKLSEMRRLFDAWPVTVLPDGKEVEFKPENVKLLTNAWKDAMFKSECEVRYYKFFRENYRHIAALGE